MSEDLRMLLLIVLALIYMCIVVESLFRRQSCDSDEMQTTQRQALHNHCTAGCL